mgnify:CR=1 FL=1
MEYLLIYELAVIAAHECIKQQITFNMKKKNH